MKAWVASILTFVGMALLAGRVTALGWFIRAISDILWIEWAWSEKPNGYRAVIISEFAFMIIDILGFCKSVGMV